MIAPSVPIKMIALDLDGTVIGDNLIVSDRVLTAVETAQARGIAVTIVTGRMFAAARPFAKTLGITGPIVCYQGAAIFDMASGAMRAETPLPADVTHDVLIRARSDDFTAQCYADDQVYVEALNSFTQKYADLSRIEPIVVPSLLDAFATRSTLKIVLVSDAERATAYTATLRAALGPRAYVTRSHIDFVEVLDPSVDKGRALRAVAQTYGIDLKAVMAVGDSWNDVPLLDSAGFAVAMGSAPPELRARADAIVADVAHDGVAEAIERFVLA